MRLTGTVFRAHNPRWSYAPLSGEGAARFGGRFNRTGIPALYTSLRMETAWREAQQGFAFKAQPLTICSYHVDCAAVADLTDAATRATHAVTPAALGCDWESMALNGQTPPTWEIVDRLASAGIRAIIVPSFAPGAIPADRNAVFWHWSDAGPCSVTVIDDEARLPVDNRSWPPP